MNMGNDPLSKVTIVVTTFDIEELRVFGNAVDVVVVV
jgi:hypothetical protein